MNFEDNNSQDKLYIIGDKILLKRNLEHNRKYGGTYYSSSMAFAVEEPVEVRDVCVEDGFYLLEHGLTASCFMIDHGRSLKLNG